MRGLGITFIYEKVSKRSNRYYTFGQSEPESNGNEEVLHST